MLHQILDWFHHLIYVWFKFVESSGYWGVIVLMAMESSIFPVPSEVVIPPAAYWAQTKGNMSFWGVVLAGTFGSWLGSAITYWISKWVGRLIVVRWGKYFFISEAKLERTEHFIRRYEAGGIFFARLLPVVRHLISIPAGIIRMNFTVFSIMTTVGAFIWCAILAWMGQRAAVSHPDLFSDPNNLDPAKLVHAVKADALPIVGIIVAFCVLYFVVMKLTAKKDGEPPRPTAA